MATDPTPDAAPSVEFDDHVRQILLNCLPRDQQSALSAHISLLTKLADVGIYTSDLLSVRGALQSLANLTAKMRNATAGQINAADLIACSTFADVVRVAWNATI